MEVEQQLKVDYQNAWGSAVTWQRSNLYKTDCVDLTGTPC